MTRSHTWILTAILAAAGTCASAGTLETQLADAAKAGNVATVRALLTKKADVNAATVDSSTPLHLAVKANNLEIVNLLLDAGANAKAETRYKITPLSLAA